jgi:hypothetical protein
LMSQQRTYNWNLPILRVTQRWRKNCATHNLTDFYSKYASPQKYSDTRKHAVLM